MYGSCDQKVLPLSSVGSSFSTNLIFANPSLRSCIALIRIVVFAKLLCWNLALVFEESNLLRGIDNYSGPAKESTKKFVWEDSLGLASSVV